ncbi:MAG TPA: division/cell wall cluster transcriptional repressor MraZ [Acidimicrobiales bacterium]|nr:division/cell wall cluster transcriptional repressor MraZ [Acidimicrobiales bacterium]
MERFYGSFEYALDAKGRIILPARLRSQFETKRALVSCYVDKCLAVWTPDEFNRYLERAESMEGHGAEGRNLARTLSALSAEVEIDGQWRLTIPANLRHYAGLEPERPVMVIGALNRIELWQVDLWQQRMAPSLESLADGTSPLFADTLPVAVPPVPSAAGTVVRSGEARL